MRLCPLDGVEQAGLLVADLTSWVAGGLRLVQLWVEFRQAQVCESLRRWRSGSSLPAASRSVASAAGAGSLTPGLLLC